MEADSSPWNVTCCYSLLLQETSARTCTGRFHVRQSRLIEVVVVVETEPSLSSLIAFLTSSRRSLALLPHPSTYHAASLSDT